MDTLYYIGIDIAKAKFDVALLLNGKFKTKVFENHRKGFEDFNAWLKAHDVFKAHICMEATGIYWEAFAEYAAEMQYLVSVVNPSIISNYAKTLMQRGKTDEQDAKIIARFCEREKPVTWVSPPPAQKQLKALMRELEHLKNQHQKESIRLLTADKVVQKRIQVHIAFLLKQIAILEKDIDDKIEQDEKLSHSRELLQSIPGVGKKTSPWLLAYLGDGSRFERGRSAAAYAGLSPMPFQSGSSVRGKTRISKKGHNDLRKILFMPALATYGKRQAFVPFINRLLESGKRPKEIVVAIMRKIITIAQAVLKSQKPFNLELHAT